PDNHKVPFTQLLWPNFASGHLSINQQAFVEEYPVSQRDPVAHMWNLGEKFGLAGHASLVPLFAAWGVIGAVWWALREEGLRGSRSAARTEPRPPAENANVGLTARRRR